MLEKLSGETTRLIGLLSRYFDEPLKPGGDKAGGDDSSSESISGSTSEDGDS